MPTIDGLRDIFTWVAVVKWNHRKHKEILNLASNYRYMWVFVWCFMQCFWLLPASISLDEDVLFRSSMNSMWISFVRMRENEWKRDVTWKARHIVKDRIPFGGRVVGRSASDQSPEETINVCSVRKNVLIDRLHNVAWINHKFFAVLNWIPR